MTRRGLVSACAALSFASFGCGALLDLDVQSIDAGAEAGIPQDEAGSDATGDSSPPDHGQPPNDAAAEVVAPNTDGSGASAPADAADAADAPADVADAQAAPPTPIRWVQQVGDGLEDDAGLSFAVTFPMAVAAHDAIIVGVDFPTIEQASVSDSLGNAYVRATGTQNGGVAAVIFYALDVAGGVDTVKVTVGAPSLMEVYVHEYSGIGAFDGTSSQAGTGPQMTSGTFTTTAPGDLLFGYGATGSATAGTGFTTRLTFNQNLTEDQIVDQPGLVQAIATSAGGADWVCLAAAFKPR